MRRIALSILAFALVACSDEPKATTPGSTPAVENTGVLCTNGKDDDGDGFKDCADQDCVKVLACVNFDAGPTDAGTTDAGTTDAGTTDASANDAGATDSGATDAATADTGADAVADTPPDVAADAGQDAAPDVPDVPPDSGTDAIADTGADVPPDVPAPVDVPVQADVPAVCLAGQTRRCWVECGLTIPAACILGDLPPRIPGIETCAAGQWGACSTLTACTGLTDKCNNGVGGKPADTKPAKWLCPDGTEKNTTFGCSGILGVACKDMAWFINWPIHECKDFCEDEQCPTEGLTEACEVHCNTPDGPVHTGERKCQKTGCDNKLYWTQCFSQDACLTKQ